MDIEPSHYKPRSPGKQPPNWHLAQEFVSSSHSLAKVDQANSASLITAFTLSGTSEELCTPSFSSDLAYSQLLLQLDSLSSLCRTKEGSIRAQQMLSKARPEDIQSAITALTPSLFQLILDPYGNYTVQTLFQSCSPEQRVYLLRAIQEHLVEIAHHPKGTHVLQTLISLCSTPEEERIYREKFKGRIRCLSTHSNASHVVQKLLCTLKNRYAFVGEILGYARQLAMDKVGLCVIKRVLNDPQVFNELIEDALVLMQDPYGNYAMQILVEMWMEELSFHLICALKGRVAQLCIQKYSSNVVEKCLKEENMRNFIVDELIAEEKVAVLLGSAYGCYVLRTAVKYADTHLKAKLKAATLAAIGTVSCKALRNRWDEILSYFE